jgi:hypothetical protein
MPVILHVSSFYMYLEKSWLRGMLQAHTETPYGLATNTSTVLLVDTPRAQG